MSRAITNMRLRDFSHFFQMFYFRKTRCFWKNGVFFIMFHKTVCLEWKPFILVYFRGLLTEYYCCKRGVKGINPSCRPWRGFDSNSYIILPYVFLSAGVSFRRVWLCAFIFHYFISNCLVKLCMHYFMTNSLDAPSGLLVLGVIQLNKMF